MMSIIRTAVYAAVAILALALVSCSPSASNVKVASHTDSLSYAIGMDLGSSFNDIGLELSSEALYKGVADALKGDGNTVLTDEEKDQLLQALNAEAMEAQRKKQEAAGEENAQKGAAFLAENQQKEGVQVTETGLQFEVIQEGAGPKPQAEDEVTVHYTGTLLNGDVFDSSVERGTPATFPLNRVIPGWTEGLQLMSKGAKYKFYIPSELAYGPNGSPPRIGANETLIFEVELLEIKPAEAATE